MLKQYIKLLTPSLPSAAVFPLPLPHPHALPWLTDHKKRARNNDEGGDGKGNPFCFCFRLLLTFRFCFHLLLTFRSRSWLAHWTYRSQPAIASDLPSASAALACHVTWYLTRTDTYLPSSVLFIISVTLYISSYPQGILILSSSDPLLGMFMS